MKIRPKNPIAFRPVQVTIITSLVYAVLIVALLIIHHVVPDAPKNEVPVAGINLTEAWQDLQTLSSGYHPYNSRRNDRIRNWLLLRLEAILNVEDVSASEQASAVVFSDLSSNVSFSVPGLRGDTASNREPGLSVYFEGTNIIVYIRGSEDEADWWTKKRKPHGKGGVLISAHYDSVSTGFGTTDDGMGVVTILQLIKYFTVKGHQPRRGIVALLNNGEEDFLNGARAYTQHPMSQFAHTFLNLEGAGAGGRATLLRGSDTEVIRFYQASPHPFGSVLSSDVFKRGVIHSQTDYIVFNEVLGLRGLDLAFMEPRARYHTDEDDTKHASINSLWHMLSAALSTTQALASDRSSNFDGDRAEKNKIPTGHGSDAVYFDLFGSSVVVCKLHTLFALSVTLLTISPLILIATGAVLFRADKLYLFSSYKHQNQSESDKSVSFQGWRGIFRPPLIFVIASAAVVGLAYLVTKYNPYIVYSSPYAVWSMMISAWFCIAWLFSRAAYSLRPTAFHRVYMLIWMFIGSWLILIAATVLEQRFELGGSYIFAFYSAATFLATLVSFLEQFGLQRKSEFADEIEPKGDRGTESPFSDNTSSDRIIAASGDEQSGIPADQGSQEEDIGESTALLSGERRTTFARYSSRHPEPENQEQDRVKNSKRTIYGNEQPWSWSLLSWLWVVEFLFLAPIIIIIVGQAGLLSVSGFYQTLADGNPPLPDYIGIGIFVILIFAPLLPFLYRHTYHIPTFFFFIFIGTLIYNLVAFPFSANNRLKVYFIQKLDLETGSNEVSLTGLGGQYLHEIIESLPSAAGQKPRCSSSLIRKGLDQCTWNGLAPQVVKSIQPGVPPTFDYTNWLFLNVHHRVNASEARFHLWGRNTRACKLQFSRPVVDFNVNGAGTDERFPRTSETGSKEIRLWSRTWEKPWDVTVRWNATDGNHHGKGLDGKVVCLWSDDNENGVIPALDEVRHYAPDWTAVSKMADGLVEGSKAFSI